jgi:hypothetical protein
VGLASVVVAWPSAIEVVGLACGARCASCAEVLSGFTGVAVRIVALVLAGDAKGLVGCA